MCTCLPSLSGIPKRHPLYLYVYTYVYVDRITRSNALISRNHITQQQLHKPYLIRTCLRIYSSTKRHKKPESVASGAPVDCRDPSAAGCSPMPSRRSRQGLELRALGFRVEGLGVGLRVEGYAFQGLGLRVWGLGLDFGLRF